MTTKWWEWLIGGVFAIWLVFWLIGEGVLVETRANTSGGRNCEYFIGLSIRPSLNNRSLVEHAKHCPIIEPV